MLVSLQAEENCNEYISGVPVNSVLLQIDGLTGWPTDYDRLFEQIMGESFPNLMKNIDYTSEKLNDFKVEEIQRDPHLSIKLNRQSQRPKKKTIVEIRFHVVFLLQ